MKAMVLAAGRGERLRPLTDRVPKPLLEVAGRPLIVHHLLGLAAAGIEEIVVNVAHLAERITAALGDGSAYGVRVHYSHESPSALDTGGGIKQALPLLGAAPFAVINADVYAAFDYAGLLDGLPADADARLWLVPNPPHHPRGDFGLQQERVVDAQPRRTFAGIGVYRPALFVGHSGRFPLTLVLAPAIAQGRVAGRMFKGRWYDVGRPDTLRALGKR
ncbi:MAG: nucleotidyltransferase family protein [Salinisphaera sp.]|nr:nucleotidyltransferase family protein [Salinisphaera sp.]MDN5937976.1 nucleotidyltransferase family protein [Salinisphaera sp.]